MYRGNPRCRDCNGDGVVRVGRGYRTCSCVRPSKTVQEMIRAANSRDGRPWRMPWSR